jgi:hypothetical protein
MLGTCCVFTQLLPSSRHSWLSEYFGRVQIGEGRWQPMQELMAELLLLGLPLERELAVELQPLGAEGDGLAPRADRSHNRRREQPQ